MTKSVNPIDMAAYTAAVDERIEQFIHSQKDDHQPSISYSETADRAQKPGRGTLSRLSVRIQAAQSDR